MHMLKWDVVCSRKKVGGIGIFSLKRRNIALLAKWWWRHMTEPDSLWNKILTSMYEDIDLMIREHHWTLPFPGAVKVNVHGATPFIPFLNGNLNGIGLIIRNSEGEFIKLATRILPSNCALENKLNAIHQGLIQAFEGCNQLTLYLERLGDEKCQQFYSFTRPIGAVEELLSIDLGFGYTAPQYQDIQVFNDEEDPVDFGHAFLPGEGVIHGGYAFHEDYYAVDNEEMEGPVVISVHEFEVEDFVLGEGC
ncbi:hypothetical protein POM88_028892 [Heracleum sosnowskyi]|uniref:Uncharacterized protein n=1 Tax=Heracleum sosnowskyi TaxID=360622 RepID=A0AAD8HSM5_9APIA|nr:hypothetical protein POM88_028892 [Heracleum sosnowskyi]